MCNTYINKYIDSTNEILNEKLNKFCDYEKITCKMINCDNEKLTQYVQKRQEIASIIDNLDIKLNNVYLESGQKLLKQAALNQIEYGDCPKELKEVFLNGQKLATIVSRILQYQHQIVDHVETQKEILLNKIKKQNTGINANASKYYNISNNIKNNLTIFDNKY